MADRWQELYRAAAREFAHGFDGASLNAMLAEAGMSKSSFYHQVADKAHLFDLVVRAALGATGVELPEIPRTAAEFSLMRSRLLEGIEAAWPSSSLPWLAGLVQAGDAPTDSELDRAVRTLHDWLTEYIGRGRELGEFSSRLELGRAVDLAWMLLLELAKEPDIEVLGELATGRISL
ncbi:MAG: TetR/AcrR family transcriptional regulator [Flaviflexus sp.]|nr:TetR/AcrR family transcriptional regulator [Flaviflexus sp.]